VVDVASKVEDMVISCLNRCFSLRGLPGFASRPLTI